MKKKLILTKGLPGSGKSTWAKEQCKNDTTIVRICRDDIREMLGPYWVPKREDIVSKIERMSIISALEDKFSTAVIVDATNLNPKTIRAMEDIARLANTEVEVCIQDFTDVDLQTCITRDYTRSHNGGRGVGEKVIRDFHERYL